ncbi:FecCD family ABC transporter permease [Saccharospirillum salsuginis]|uniref:Iron ABC transporter permease n=1 Tax=Saccharospirillum salsuginis TaxID=418750 RepID=A0A918KB52_9GAMM|nr:iron ABC transporter permease [Saccharospirillum salsuginis]GGX54920.1 iron ABC transporter permease [Saccharospirillum salsuginis]
MTTHYLLRSRSEHLALAFHRQTILRCLLLLVILLAGFVAYLCIGSTMLTPLDVAVGVFQPERSDHQFVIQTLRLPRGLLAVLVGAGLGVSGAILQQVVRNPLASPDIIGISDGAAAAAMLYLSLMAGGSIAFLPPVAMVGAGIASMAIYALAWKNSGVLPIRLVLVGIALAMALKAVVTLILVMGPMSTTIQAYVWLTGSLYGAGWQDVYGMLPWVAGFVPLTLLAARPLGLMGMNDSHALGLGLAVGRYRLLLLLCSVALAGSAVAFAGGIAFVGLIAPHLARGFTGRTMPGLILGSCMTGALLLLLADLIGRSAFLPQDLPAGIFVSAVGAPFFIYLLYRRRTH